MQHKRCGLVIQGRPSTPRTFDDGQPLPTLPTPPAATKPLSKQKQLFIPIAIVGALLALTACASTPDDQAEVASVTTEAEVAIPAETDVPATVAEPADEVPDTAAVEAVAAPAALCQTSSAMNLQDAQDLIQQQGVFLSMSEDATGQDRMQVMDSNWVVVSQNIEPGHTFGEGEAVLSVVKYTKSRLRPLHRFGRWAARSNSTPPPRKERNMNTTIDSTYQVAEDGRNGTVTLGEKGIDRVLRKVIGKDDRQFIAYPPSPRSITTAN